MFNQNIQCKKILSLFLVLSGTAFLSGCVYHNYGSPHINGVITDQGQTLAGVKVSLANFDQKYRQPPPIPRDISRLFRKASGMFLFPLVHKIA